jgi:hypothetical protein
MRRTLPLAAMTAFAVSVASAHALDSTVIKMSSMSPDALWKKVGDFCGIGSWHPAVAKCVLSADGKQRTLSLKGRGTIVEELEGWDNLNQVYIIIWTARHQLSLDSDRDWRRGWFPIEMDEYL